MSIVTQEKPAVSKPDASEILQNARSEGRSALPESDGKELLSSYGIAVPQRAMATDPALAAAAAAGMKGPFVVKVSSPDILHKSDVGGVKVGLQSPEAVAEAVAEMQEIPAIAAARVDGFWSKKWHPPAASL